jgi:hypothetical protein
MKAKILPIRALKIGPTQFQAEVERLQAEGRMPSLPELLDVVTEARTEYSGKILAARADTRKALSMICCSVKPGVN